MTNTLNTQYFIKVWSWFTRIKAYQCGFCDYIKTWGLNCELHFLKIRKYKLANSPEFCWSVFQPVQAQATVAMVKAAEQGMAGVLHKLPSPSGHGTWWVCCHCNWSKGASGLASYVLAFLQWWDWGIVNWCIFFVSIKIVDRCSCAKQIWISSESACTWSVMLWVNTEIYEIEMMARNPPVTWYEQHRMWPSFGLRLRWWWCKLQVAFRTGKWWPFAIVCSSWWWQQVHQCRRWCAITCRWRGRRSYACAFSAEAVGICRSPVSFFHWCEVHRVLAVQNCRTIQMQIQGRMVQQEPKVCVLPFFQFVHVWWLGAKSRCKREFTTSLPYSITEESKVLITC